MKLETRVASVECPTKNCKTVVNYRREEVLATHWREVVPRMWTEWYAKCPKCACVLTLWQNYGAQKPPYATAVHKGVTVDVPVYKKIK